MRAYNVTVADTHTYYVPAGKHRSRLTAQGDTEAVSTSNIVNQSGPLGIRWEMTGGEALLRRVVNNFGAVRRIFVDDSDPVVLSVVEIMFDSGRLRIAAVATDDTIVISEPLGVEVARCDVSDVHPWSSLAGGQSMWIWTLTNQQGYADGVQFYMRSPARDVIFQLLVIGSSLKPHTVREEW